MKRRARLLKSRQCLKRITIIQYLTIKNSNRSLLYSATSNLLSHLRMINLYKGLTNMMQSPHRHLRRK